MDDLAVATIFYRIFILEAFGLENEASDVFTIYCTNNFSLHDAVYSSTPVLGETCHIEIVVPTQILIKNERTEISCASTAEHTGFFSKE